MTPLEAARKTLVMVRSEIIDYGSEGYEPLVDALDVVVQFLDDIISEPDL